MVLNLFFLILLGSEGQEKVLINIQRGNWTRPQRRVLIIFAIVIVLWITRDFIASYTGVNFKDSSVAILGGIALFFIPAVDSDQKLLRWQDTVKIPWGILVLFGGGIALSLIHI